MADQRDGTYRIVAAVILDDLPQEPREQLRVVARDIVVVDPCDPAVGNLHRHESVNIFTFPGDEPRMRTRSPERIVVVLAQYAAPHDQRRDECVEARRSSVQFFDCHIPDAAFAD